MIDSEISKSFVSCHINPEIDASKRSRKIADPKGPRSGPGGFHPIPRRLPISKPTFLSTKFHKYGVGERSTDFDSHFSHVGPLMVDDNV